MGGATDRLIYEGTFFQDAVDDLTENGGAIGGTNDGDLPDIGTISATYTQAEVEALRDAIRELADRVNTLQARLRDSQLIKT